MPGGLCATGGSAHRFARVAAEIRGLPRNARLTVFFETPATLAMSAIVASAMRTVYESITPQAIRIACGSQEDFLPLRAGLRSPQARELIHNTAP